jgi:integrase/recombinase XerD
MANVDDIHAFQKGFAAALKRIDESEISDHNKEIIKKFIIFCTGHEISTSTCTIYLNSLHRIAIRVKKNLDEMAESDYEFLLLNLKSKGYKEGYIYQYKKTIKKFFKWRFDLDVPRWVARIQLKATDTPVQPSDLITKDEIDKLYQACNNPREKALIAVLLDSGMRIGALGSLRIKNIEFNQFGAILYLSKTSQSNKSTVAKGIPITWSTGHLNQWLAMHPNKDNPEAPLWVNLKGRDRGKAMSYNTIRKALKDVGERSGVKKRIHPHLFRHTAITGWIMEKFTEQEVKHRAGWSKSNRRMFEVYGNFTDQEINKSIYAHYGLTAEEKSTKLERCPRCHAVLVQGARMCHQCALVLDAGLEKELKVGEDHAQKALLKMMESPEVRAMLKEMMNK